MRTLPNTIAGKYVLLEAIGEGGVGVVYRAAQPALSRSVAIKLLRRNLADDPDALRRFRAEAHAAARITHPNSVTVIDCGTTDDGTPYIVMEHVRGDTLRALLHREGALPFARAVGIVQQILAGLAEAHRAAVVHADIKTDNILVEPTRDGGERVKIVDFGLAELRRDHAARARTNDTGETWTVAGTPEYMAPEVIRGQPATSAADLYAVGIVLYELLTGATPFGGGTANEILSRHVDDRVVPPSLRRPDLGIPEALEAVVLRSLDKHPGARFANATAFSTALSGAPLTPAVIGPSRCESCGLRRPPSDRFCGGCGVAAGATAPSAPSDATTKVVRQGVRPARGSTPIATRTIERMSRIRDEIGAAIVRGDSATLADGYVALARTLAAGSRVAEAVRELEEGIELLGSGRVDEDRSEPASRLMTTCAALRPYTRSGTRQRSA